MSFIEQHFFTDAYQSIIDKTVKPIFLAQHLHLLLNFCSNISSAQDHDVHKLLLSLVNSDNYDHLEGGFFNPQSSKTNTQPDFQKTLINNANFINLLSHASGYFFEGLFSVPAINSAQWVINNLQSPTGAFYKAMNNDTLAEYYSIELSQIKQQLDSDCTTAFLSTYGIDELATVPINRITRKRSYQQVSEATGMHIKQVPLALEAARQLLSLSRDSNKVPQIDNTIHIIENSKIISALYNAARQFNRDDFASAATLALTDIHSRKPDNDSFSDNECLALLSTLLHRLQYQWNDQDYQWLKQLSLKVVKKPDSIIQSIKEHDFNNIITDFFNLYILTSDPLFLTTAHSVRDSLHEQLTKTTDYNPSQLLALLKAQSEHYCIIIRGSKHESLFWLQQLATGFKPANFVFAIANDCNGISNELFPEVTTTQAVVCTTNNTVKTYLSLDNLLSDFA